MFQLLPRYHFCPPAETQSGFGASTINSKCNSRQTHINTLCAQKAWGGVGVGWLEVGGADGSTKGTWHILGRQEAERQTFYCHVEISQAPLAKPSLKPSSIRPRTHLVPGHPCPRFLLKMLQADSGVCVCVCSHARVCVHAPDPRLF